MRMPACFLYAEKIKFVRYGMKTIGKHLKPVILLVLALVMLFTAGATAVFAAEEAEQQQQAQAPAYPDNTGEGGKVTGWLDVTYGADGVTLTITPSIAEIKAITKDEIKSLVSTFVEAFKKVAVDEIKNDYIAGMGNITSANLVEKVIELYIAESDEAPDGEDGLVWFFEEVVKDEFGAREDFIDFACDLLAAAINIGAIDKSELPDEDEINTRVHDYIDGYITAKKTEIDNAVSAYINWLLYGGEKATGEIADEVNAKMDAEVQAYVKTLVEAYVEHLKNPDAKPSDFQGKINDAFDIEVNKEATKHIDAFFANGTSGDAKVDTAINQVIEDVKNDVISRFSVETFISHKQSGTDDDDHVYSTVAAELDKKINAWIEDIVDHHKNGTAIDAGNLLYTSFPDMFNDPAKLEALAQQWEADKTATVNTMWDTLLADKDAVEKATDAVLADDAAALDYMRKFWGNNHDKFIKKVDEHLVEDPEIAEHIISSFLGDITEIKSYLSSLSSDLKEKLVTEISDYAEAVIEKVIDDAVDEYCKDKFEVDYDGFMAYVESFKSDFVLKYSQTVKNAGSFSAKELLLMINSIGMGEHGETLYEIYGNDENGNKKIQLANIIELLRTLPAIDKIANMKEEEMFLSYDFYLDTIYGDADFNITVVASPEAYDYIHRAANVVNRYVSIGLAEDGTFVADVKMPAIFTEAVLKACETGKIPESLKDKVFTAMASNPDEAYAFFMNLEYSEIITILEKIDFEEVLNNEQIKYYVELIDKYIDKVELQKLPVDTIAEKLASVSGKSKEQIKGYIEVIFDLVERTDFATLTNEQIIAKLEGLAPHFNTFKELVAKVYNRVPDGIKTKDIFDLYEGGGVFGLDAEINNINVADYIVKLVSRFNEDIADDIMLFIDDMTVDVKVDLSVAFNDIYSVEFYLPGQTEPYRAGFLPTGATLATFADKTATSDGKTILGWVDKSTGALLTEMPEGDTAVEALIVNEIKSPVGFEGASDGTVFTLNAGVAGNYDLTALGAKISYQWYKDGAAVTGATAAVINLKEAADSGVYYCVITVSTDLATASYTTDTATVKISSIDSFNKVDVNTSDIKFVENGVFEYTGTEHTVALDSASYNGTLINVELVGGTLKATDAGVYSAAIKISLVNEENTLLYVDGKQIQSKVYEFTKTWEIKKKSVSVGDFSFNLKENTFTYNANERTVTLVSADTELVKFILGGVTKATNSGVYTANVILSSIDANHQLTGANAVYSVGDTVASLTWSINAIRLDYTKFTVISKADLEAAAALLALSNLTTEYNGETQGYVLDTSVLNLPDGASVLVIEYTGDSEAKLPGTYNMKVRVKIAPEHRQNYILVDENNVAVADPDAFVERDFTWVIELKSVNYADLKEFIKLDFEVFKFDGKAHKPALDAEALLGLPEGVEVLEFIVDEQKFAGQYTAVVVVKNTRPDLNVFYDADGNVTDKAVYTLAWQISEENVKLDTLGIALKENSFVYTGMPVSVELAALANSDLKFELVGDVVKTGAGQYSVQVKYLGTTYNDFILLDGDNVIAPGTVLPEAYNLTWSISKKQVVVKYDGFVGAGGLVYDGTDKYVDFIVNYDPAVVKVTKTGLSGVNAKNDYKAILKVELLDKDNYTLVVNETIYDNGEFTAEETWAIAKAKADVSIGALVGAGGLVYNGSAQTVNFGALVYDENIVTVNISGNIGTDADSYTAKAVITLNEAARDNYDLYVNGELIAENEKEITEAWTIAKATLDMSGAYLKNESTTYYDGINKTHVLAGVTLPEGINCEISYYDLATGKLLAEAPVMVGHYKAVAEFTGSNKNYNGISGMEKTFVISALPINFAGTEIVYKSDDYVYDASAKLFDVVTPADIAKFINYVDIVLVYTDENGNKVDAVKNAGNYTVSAIISVKPEYEGLYTVVNAVVSPKSITVEPRVIDLTDAVIELSGDTVFTGVQKNFIITVGGTDVSEYLSYTFKFKTVPDGMLTDAIKAGKYLASVKSLAVRAEHGEGNVVIEGNPFEIADLEFEITKKTVDVTGAKLEFADGNTFSAKEKEVIIKLASGETLPLGIKFTITDASTGELVTFRNAKTYNVKINFEVIDGYEDSCEIVGGPEIEARISISKAFVNRSEAVLVFENATIDGTTIRVPYTGAAIDFFVGGFSTVPSSINLKSLLNVTFEIRDENGNIVDEIRERGTYTVKISSISLNKNDPESGNYNFRSGSNPEYTVIVERGVINLDGVGFAEEDLVVNYDGFKKVLLLTGYLPNALSVQYINNVQTEIGKYNVTAIITLIDTKNYMPISADNTVTIEAEFEIKSNPETFYIKDSSGKIIAEVTANNGIPAGYTLSNSNVTFAYDTVKFSEALGIKYKDKLAKIHLAYDLNFTDANGDLRAVNDVFTIRFRLPESLRGNSNLIAVYINDDGVVEYEIPYIDENGYVVFNTDHFSTYALAEVIDAPAEDESKFPWWIILIIVIAIIIIIIVVVVIKKKSSKPTEPTEPAEEAPVEPLSDEEAQEETEEPEVEEPAVEEPAVEEPAVEEPVVEEPAVEEPAAEEPAVEEPAVEEPVVEEPVAEEPAVEEPVVEEPANDILIAIAPANGEEDESIGQRIINGQVVLVSYRSSYMSRLIQADSEIQDYYTVIKNTLLSYKGVKSRVSWNFESFNKGRVQCAKLNLKGRALLVYIGLDPNEYNISKYHFVDVSDKPKFEKVPMLMKVKSDRGLKYVLELIEEMMLKNEIPQGELPNEDYHMPYETTEELVKRDLVKVILPPGVTLDENSNIEKLDVGELIDNANANKSDDEEQAIEEAPAEEIPEAVEEAPAEEVTEVVEEAPVEEIPEAAEEAPIEEIPEVVEEAPVEEIPEVVEETPAEEIPEVVEEAPVEEVPEVVEEAPVEEIHVDAVHADELLTDEEAEAKIEVIARTTLATSTKMAEINLDTICENYDDGETVELQGLQQKRLVNKKAGKLKVLARGVMTKRLTVIADKFSLQAVKMITLAGGVAEQLK